MKNIRALPFIIWILLSAVSCDSNKYIELHMTEGDKKIIQSLLEDYPLPEEHIIIGEKNKKEADYSLSLKRENWTSDDLLPLEHRVTIKESIFCPTVDFNSPVTAATLDEASQYNIRNINNIRLPERALPVDGLYPDDGNYPLKEKVYLELHIVEPVDEQPPIVQWIRSLPRVKTDTEITWVGAVGDIMVQRGVERILYASDEGIKTIFGDVLDEIARQELMLGNLEGAVTTAVKRYPKSFNFKFDPKILPVLEKAGFHYLSIANNHVYDYLEKGFLDTLDYLEASSIGYSGGGRTKEQAATPFRTTVDNTAFSILGIGAFPNEKNGFSGLTHGSVTDERAGMLWTGDYAYKAMKKEFSEKTFDIVFAHGGREWTDEPYDEQIELYRKYIDLGADLVVSSHPHVLQGLEVYKGRLIAYSLGNFIFPGMDEMKHAEESLLLSAGLHGGEIKYLRYVPVKINNRTVSIDQSGTILPRFHDLTESLK